MNIKTTKGKMATQYAQEFKRKTAESAKILKEGGKTAEEIGDLTGVAASLINKWVKALNDGKLKDTIESQEKLFRHDSIVLSKKVDCFTELFQKTLKILGEMQVKIDEVHRIVKDEDEEIKKIASEACEEG